MRSIPEQTKQRLRELRQTLNPFLLSDTIQRKVHAVLAKLSPRLTQSPLTNEHLRAVSKNSGIKTRKTTVPTKRTANQQAGGHLAAKTTKHKYKGK
jgi:hypothetical protein